MKDGRGQLQVLRTHFRLALLVALLLVPGAAGAFEIFGWRLFEDQADRDVAAVIADPQPYEVELVTGVEGDLDAAIRGASALVADQDEPASGAAGLLAKARGDYRRITGALYGQGHYGGTINILVDGVEAARLPPDTDLPDPVSVRVVVDPGPLFRFGTISIANRPPPAADDDQVESPEDYGLARGEVARSTVVAGAEQRLLEGWRQQGYAKAAIADRQVIADHRTRTVDVAITVDPDRRAAIGAVGVSGTTHMDPDFVRTQSGLEPGEEYDPDAIERARKRLSRLEVFRSLRLQAAEDIGPEGMLPYTIVVDERPLHRVGAGASWSSVDGIGVEGFWLHRNLFGRAERLRLDARIAGIGYPVETEEFDYMFGGTFTKPGIFTPDTDLVAAISAERTVVPTYIETSATVRAGLTHLLSDEITLEGSAAYELAQFEDDFGTRVFSTASLFAGATFDNRDEPLDATEGFFVTATMEPFYEFNRGNVGLRTTAEARTYFGFAEDDMFVLAGRLRAGLLLGPDLADIPPDRLFFAGGGGSVRGYGYRSIGVEGPGGTVTGGRYLLEASVEARVRFNEEFGGVAFVDGGYVAADTFPGLEDLRLGAGVGLRYYTGLGPLRLDLAFPLNGRPGDPAYAIYAGIGQAF
ncbi:MAG TPA: autotransporter assembly complex family protein [Devosiaceae bacterium]|jgi:translocation and assembly module TamA|nr:autotransporter assembly complex family protein [Devosiaceae bacterium]